PYQIEQSHPLGADEAIKRALAPIIAVTWRHVDNVFDPHRGGVLNLQLAAGSKALASGDDFLKTYAQYQYWIPLGPMDQLILRAEAGRPLRHRARLRAGPAQGPARVLRHDRLLTMSAEAPVLEPPPPPHTRARRRWFVRVLALLGVLILVVAGGLAWLLHTQGGAR